MPAIPVYQQQTAASGGLAVRPNIGNPGAGFIALGEGLNRAVETVDRMAENDARKQAADNLAEAHLTATKAGADWTQYFVERKNSAAPGAPDFTPAVLKDFDAYRAKALATAKDDRSRAYLNDELEQLRGRLGTEALTFEAAAGVRYRAALYGQSVDNTAISVRADPAQFDSALARQGKVLDNSRLDPQARELAWQATKEQLAGAAVETLIDRNPATTLKALQQAPGKSGIPAVEVLSYEGRERARAAAQAEINRRESDARANAVQARESLHTAEQDAFAAKASGLPASLPSRAQYVAAYGAEGIARYSQSSKLFSIYDAVGSVVTAPPAQAEQALAAFRPTEQSGAADQVRVAEGARRLYDAQRKAFEQDPAGYLVRSDLGLRGLLTAATGPEAKPEAVAQYVSRVTAAQTAAGIAQPKLLPGAAADSLSTSLTFDPEKPGRRVETLQALQAQWGRYYPQVIRELAPKLEGDARILANMRPEEAKRYDQVLSQAKDVRANLDAATKQKVQEEVRKALQPLAASLMTAPDGDARLMDHIEATQLLAASMVNRGVSPDDAAERAAAVVVNERYTFRDSLRIPKGVDADMVVHTADGILQNLQPSTLAVVKQPSATLEAAQADLARAVQKNGFWVTSADESGIELRIPYADSAVPVTRTDGKRIRYTWAQLAAMPATPPVPPYMAQGAR